MAIEKSIVRRYLLLSLIASVLPVLFVGLLYDRFVGAALEQVLGERVSAHLTATASRLGAFLEARRYQVETLANYPGIRTLVAPGKTLPAEEVTALLQVESDLPDLYGILFFDADFRLQRVVAGQAASGPPYWGASSFAPGRLPATEVGESSVVGPMPPRAGESGWLLLRHPLPGARPEGGGASIALHVRLASLTELMGSNAAGGALEPILRTPDGYFNTVGQAVVPKGKLIAGPEILPGWQPMLEVEASQLLQSFDGARRALLVAVLVGAVLIVVLFFRLSKQLGRRVDQLVAGAAAVSSGRLEYRIADQGDDEIARVSHAFNAMAGKLQDFFARMLRLEKLAVLGEFATRIAHEVRNPLAAIKTTVQALARREQDAKRLQLLGDVENEIDRVARVVSDLLDFGRPRPPEPAPVPVREVFGRITAIVESEAEAKGVHVSAQGESDIVLHVDRDQLQQILLNLVLNALQATPREGAIVLRALREEGRAVIEVSDTGSGIPADLLARVAEPFFTTKTKGMGLGLSISRQLTELNGGRMDIDSVAGRGTLVRIQLPLAEANDAQHPDH